MLVIQDCFAKWLEVAPLANKTVVSVTDAFMTTWVARYGPPRILHQDNGSEFTADIFREVRKLMVVSRTTTSSYYPRSNGQVERVNQTVQHMLECICEEIGLAWLVSQLAPIGRHNMTWKDCTIPPPKKRKKFRQRINTDPKLTLS